MSTIFNNVYSVFLVPFLVGIITIPALIRFSVKNKTMVDVADGDVLKIHKQPVPLFGGLAMALAVLVGFLLTVNSAVFAIILAGAVVFFLGFYDDFKWKHISTIKPLLKFSLLIFCTLVPAIILYLGGTTFNFIPLAFAGIFCTFIYIFVVINAVNYQDGMDGLAGGLVGISVVGFLALALLQGNEFLASICVIVLAAVLSFLVFNLPPAKIFMGDSGAYFLGFMISVIAISFSKPYNLLSVISGIVIIGLPIFDGVFTNIRRVMQGKSIFLGDRSHFYDKLMQKGFSVKKTLLICYSVQLILVLIGVIIYT